MKHLLLLRHAQAGPGLGTGDHERSLTRQGRDDARRLGALLAERELRPALALCSSARRAQETLEVIRSLVVPAPAVELEQGLYLADVGSLLARLREVDEDVGSVLLVGHNPAIGELARRLAVTGEADALSRLQRGMPAGALAVLRLEKGGWCDLAAAGARLIGLLTPGQSG